MYIIFVKGLTGRTAEFYVESSDPIYKLQFQVQEAWGDPWEFQNMSLYGKILNRLQTLSEYNIQKGSTIHLVLLGCTGGNRLRYISSDDTFQKFRYSMMKLNDKPYNK